MPPALTGIGASASRGDGVPFALAQSVQGIGGGGSRGGAVLATALSPWPGPALCEPVVSRVEPYLADEALAGYRTVCALQRRASASTVASYVAESSLRGYRLASIPVAYSVRARIVPYAATSRVQSSVP